LSSVAEMLFRTASLSSPRVSDQSWLVEEKRMCGEPKYPRDVLRWLRFFVRERRERVLTERVREGCSRLRVSGVSEERRACESVLARSRSTSRFFRLDALCGCDGK
jgi:hypothetical protein